MLIYLGINVLHTEVFSKEYIGNADYYYLNANYYQTNLDKVIDDIKKYNPKYVVIVELNNDLYNLIKKELGYYKYII